MSARMRSVSAVILSVSAPPVLQIDVGPDPPPVLLLLPSAGWARSSSISESSEQLLSIAPRLPHSESQEPWCATTWPVVRRRVALHSSIAGVACRADGQLLSEGRARSESVSASSAMVGWALSIGLIDSPFSHWTHVTFKHPSRMGRLVLNLIVTSPQMTVSPPAQLPSLEIIDSAQTWVGPSG